MLLECRAQGYNRARHNGAASKQVMGSKSLTVEVVREDLEDALVEVTWCATEVEVGYRTEVDELDALGALMAGPNWKIASERATGSWFDL